MIDIEVSCSKCGKMLPDVFSIEKQQHYLLSNLKATLEKHGWIVELNGDSIDTYCSKECAK